METREIPPTSESLRSRLPSQEILHKEYSRRKTVNTSYSKRSFAKNLGLSPAFLVQLMSGKRRLTPKIAQALSAKLALSPEERHSLASESTGFGYSGYLKPSTAASEGDTLPGKMSQELNWWDLAILEYFETSARSQTGSHESVSRKQLASQLGITAPQVTKSIRGLVELGIIREDEANPGNYVKCNDTNRFVSTKPSSALLGFHSSILEKARESLYLDPQDDRMIGTLTIAFDPKDIPEVRKRWREFKESLEGLIIQGADRSRVYCAAFELFPLTRPEKALKTTSPDSSQGTTDNASN